MKRKDFLGWLGLGSAFFGTGYWFSRQNKNPNSEEICVTPVRSQSYSGLSPVGNPETSAFLHNSYGGMYHAPMTIRESYGDRFYFPPDWQSDETKNFKVSLYPMNLSIANNITYPAWTYDGLAPGPIFRKKEGDILNFHFENKSSDPHSLHFHGNHDPAFDGWTGVPPFGNIDYTIECDPVGILPYHCHVPPLAQHISKGLYGCLLVDPIRKRKKAHEYVLILSGWDLEGKGKNDLYTWNGIAGFYDRYPIKVPVGETVRFYIVNTVEYDPIMTFHLHSKTFDIYRSGGEFVSDHSDVVSLGQTERVMIEFTLKKRGRYMFHPHQSYMAERGAMGWIVGI